MRQVVLVPLDGSSAAESVIPIAREAAQNLGATVRLLHVSDQPLERDALLNAVMLQPESILGSVLEGASGPPAVAILRAAASDDVALIVMCSTGSGGDTNRPLGSTAEAVLGAAPCPVLLASSEVGTQFATEHRHLRRMLLPLDGRPDTAAALGPAAEIASLCDATLDVLHVIGPRGPGTNERGALSFPHYLDQPHLAVQTWTREFLRRFCSGFTVQPEHLIVELGEPGEVIVRVARELKSDVILIAWKGQFDHDRARAANAVLREAPCPVLFLRTSAGIPAESTSTGRSLA